MTESITPPEPLDLTTPTRCAQQGCELPASLCHRHESERITALLAELEQTRAKRDEVRKLAARRESELIYLRAELVTMTAVAQSNKRHVEAMAQELEQAKTLLHTIWHGTVNAPARERWLRLIADASPTAVPQADDVRPIDAERMCSDGELTGFAHPPHTYDVFHLHLRCPGVVASTDRIGLLPDIAHMVTPLPAEPDDEPCDSMNAHVPHDRCPG